MQALKNIAVGFLVSFLGSIPLGYLNVVGYDVYARSGTNAMLLYLLGVMVIEGIVIYGTLIFANKLMSHTRLIKFIEGFSVVFMFVLAYVFFASGKGEVVATDDFTQYRSPLLLGIVLSCFNFISIPFWTGWNLYLLNNGHISMVKSQKFTYVFGTLIGTFTAMVILILSLNWITTKTEFFSKYLMGAIIPIGFAAMGIYQAVKFYRKYFGKKLG